MPTKQIAYADEAKMATLYTVQHLTMQQIADSFGVTKTCVMHHLRRFGVSREAGTWVDVKCAQCGVSFRMKRCRWRKTAKQYCSTACYAESTRNPDYIESRQGQCVGRRVASRYVELFDGMVVHHHDLDTRNNAVSNLAVFASQADHMSFERGGKGRPIWDGRDLPKP